MSRHYPKILRLRELAREISEKSQNLAEVNQKIMELEGWKDAIDFRRAYLTVGKLVTVKSQILYSLQGYRRLIKCYDRKVLLVEALARDGSAEARDRQEGKLIDLERTLYREKRYIKKLKRKKAALKEKINELTARSGDMLTPIAEEKLQAEQIKQVLADLQRERDEIMQVVLPGPNQGVNVSGD